MKKQIVFILAAFISVLSVSCTKDDDREITPDTPDVSETQFLPVSDTRITVGPEAGTHVIQYEIVEPTGASVTAEAASGTDWITEINTTSAYGEVYFTVSVNSGNESRTADIVLAYEEQILEFTVTQEPYASFTLTVQESECTSGKIVWTVVPPDQEITYVSMAVDNASWDSYASYEEYIAYDIEYFQEQAAKRNLSYEEFLEKYVLKQGEGTYSAEDLSADSDYIVYAYGMDAAGNILTDMYYAQAKTLPVTPEDVVFELSVEQNVEDWTLTISAVPNNDEVRYLMDVYNGTNTPEVIAESYQEMLDEIIYLLPILGGGTVYDYFMEMSYQGEATSTPIDLPMASEFTAFAVAIDVYTGQIISKVSMLVCESEI